ncbi:hypothetical protein DPX16_23379 [Anabarilius grahami]|uniref:Retrotransposon gag domain-containing protein n=1 Tax=Anabarilius grahami TaxID=495550 RepID=A0A3N0Y136_ANAGA|nr:hypothetical protein DPX16_23379 [Anabarilius grahami]
MVVSSVPVWSPCCSSPVPGCSSSSLVARLDPGIISPPRFTSPPHFTNGSSQSLRLPKSALVLFFLYYCLLSINGVTCICFLCSIMTERSDPVTEAAGAQQTSLEDFLNSSIRRMESQERNLNETGRAVQALVVQGNSSITDYALHFHTLMAVSWNEPALLTTFCEGLEPSLWLHLYDDAMGPDL